MTADSYPARRPAWAGRPRLTRALLDASMVLLASAAAQLVVVLQGGEPIATGWLVAFGVLAVVLLQLRAGRRSASTLEDVGFVLSATALAAVAVLALRLQLAFEPAAAVETIRQWTFVAAYALAARVGLAWRAPAAGLDDPAVAETPSFQLLVVRELARARRHAHPLTLLVLDTRVASIGDVPSRGRVLQEAAQALPDVLRLTDAFGVLQGRLVAILPDTGPERVAGVLARLGAALPPEVVSRLEFGHAGFPDEEVTLVGLQERALGRSAPLPVPAAEPGSRPASAEEAAA